MRALFEHIPLNPRYSSIFFEPAILFTVDISALKLLDAPAAPRGDHNGKFHEIQVTRSRRYTTFNSSPSLAKTVTKIDFQFFEIFSLMKFCCTKKFIKFVIASKLM